MSHSAPDSPISAHEPLPRLTRSPLLLADLLRHLLWPKLLSVPRLAMAPAALLPAIALCLLMLTIEAIWHRALGLPENWSGVLSEPLTLIGASARSSLAAAQAGNIAEAIGIGAAAFISIPRRIFSEYWPAAPLLLVLLGGLALVTTASARSAVMRAGRNERLSVPEALRFAVMAAPNTFIAWLVPIMLALGAWAGLWLLSALLGTSGLNVIVAVLLPIPLIITLLIVLALVISVLAAPLAPGAAAADNADVFDIVQRQYSYVLARPLQLVVYLVIAGLVLALTLAVATGMLRGVSALWSQAASVGLESSAPLGDRNVGSATTTGHIISFWWAIAVASTVGVLVSASGAACGVLYLIVRRLVDGQRESELWMPGLLPGTLLDVTPATGPTPAATPPSAPVVAAPTPEPLP